MLYQHQKQNVINLGNKSYGKDPRLKSSIEFTINGFSLYWDMTINCPSTDSCHVQNHHNLLNWNQLSSSSSSTNEPPSTVHSKPRSHTTRY